MKTKLNLIVLLTAMLSIVSNKVLAHCEIPCGIYEDSLRISLIYEDITTIEKSMKEINEISQSENINYNQLVRWINNKEEHANKIQDIVSQYFLNQRIKITEPQNLIAYEDYQKMLELLHKMMVYSMKTKQTTDLKYIDLLRETLNSFEGIYFHEH